MKCPKCQVEQVELSDTCCHCGIVFEKYYKYHPRTSQDLAQHTLVSEVEEIDSDEIYTIKALLFSLNDTVDPVSLAGRCVVFVALFVWGWTLMMSTIESNYVGESLMHLINLPFHEAGHVIFRLFGSFMSSLGGTLGQILMPTICLGVLLIKTRDPFGASVGLWWIGENFLDIAPYINDARAGNLPLLGGNFGHSSPYGFHDWEYILNESGLIHYDHTLAKISFFIGSITILLSFLWGGIVLFKQYKIVYP